MDRRKFLAGTASVTAGAAIGKPAIVQAQASRVIKFVPEADIVVFDPVVTPSAQTREHAWLIYDTLYGVDDKYNPHPQMAEGHVIENNGLTWKVTLREGLKFHDGERVLARDAAASVNRWTKRDSFGQALGAAANEIVATGDRVLEFRLKKPFPLLPDALGKTMAYMCPIMPERIAMTDPFKPITDPIGSGPYKYVANERVPGARVVYERFADYVPRKDGPIETTAGPKRRDIRARRMEDYPGCRDGGSSVAARRDRLAADPEPRSAPDAAAQREHHRPYDLAARTVAYMRFNQLHPPFDNPALRRAIIGAISNRTT